MTLKELIDDLPNDCNVGTKRNSKGYKESWVGYGLHIDAADEQPPISCILTSASRHDSQAAIPLARMTTQRGTTLYDLSDSVYDASAFHEQLRGLGRIPIIDIHPLRDQASRQSYKPKRNRNSC
jgi:hypothetical protein